MDITTQERVVIRTTTNYVVSWSLIIMSWSLSWSFPIGLYYPYSESDQPEEFFYWGNHDDDDDRHDHNNHQAKGILYWGEY